MPKSKSWKKAGVAAVTALGVERRPPKPEDRPQKNGDPSPAPTPPLESSPGPRPSGRSLPPVAGLLMVSGTCSLIYQVAWLREFRLVFGASTPASAAVLAIFMGGLGLGNAILGRRADHAANPLALYAKLECLIALATALSPWLIDLTRGLYVGLGGQMVLGVAGATAVRLLLSALVLALPTVLMGGTLPAAARAVTTAGDRNRRCTAVLYGMNTLGAVLGAALSTFVLLQQLGTRHTLWLTCLANLLVAAGAWTLSRRPCKANVEPGDVEEGRGDAETRGRGESKVPVSARPRVPSSPCPVGTPAALVYLAAGIVGFAFFLMEMVWYRMLGPILGGTTFTFGLILTVALLGIGLGGAAYSLLFRRLRPTLCGFAVSCGLEAAAIAAAFALGDELALLAGRFHQANTGGFLGEVFNWSLIAMIVVFPAALVSGLQFPLLIGLLGQGEKDLGKQVGTAFAWNTVGAILGSLAGGFGILPLLSAPGTWCAVVILLSLVALSALLAAWRREGKSFGLAAGLGAVVMALAMLNATGPTAVWRHSGIGAGRFHMPRASGNELRDWVQSQRRAVLWQAEGVEASVSIVNCGDGLSFFVNGKGDGHAIIDADTQITSGILGALVHPQAQTAFIVGLGTGETAGWLAEVPGMKQVDVAEIEPAIDAMARCCSAVNFNVLQNPKVRLVYNDAREVLLTSPQRYDLIFSEPSNPYRSGIASLYTRQFYQTVEKRLNPRGIFIQWLQGYEIDRQTVRTALATLHSVFPQVEVWFAKKGDVLLVCSAEPLQYDAARMRSRIVQEPFRSAFAFTWRATTLEAVLAHYVAGAGLAAAVAKRETELCTDDRNLIEYGFARSLGKKTGFSLADLRRPAVDCHADRPTVRGEVSWQQVADHRQVMEAALEGIITVPENPTAAEKTRAKLFRCYWKQDTDGAVAAWQSAPYEPLSPTELAVLCLCYADQGNDRVKPLLDRLRAFSPLEADVAEASLRSHQGRYADAAASLCRAYRQLRQSPWALPDVLGVAFGTAGEIVRRDPSQALPLYLALREPLAVGAGQETRLATAHQVASFVNLAAFVESEIVYEPYVPWREEFLRVRATTYAKVRYPLAAQAEADLRQYQAAAGRDSQPAMGQQSP
jgi:predicted membrane-bound spermidine synthase